MRKAVKADGAQLCTLLNEIIIIGGSTAFEVPLSAIARAVPLNNGTPIDRISKKFQVSNLVDGPVA